MKSWADEGISISIRRWCFGVDLMVRMMHTRSGRVAKKTKFGNAPRTGARTWTLTFATL